MNPLFKLIAIPAVLMLLAVLLFTHYDIALCDIDVPGGKVRLPVFRARASGRSCWYMDAVTAQLQALLACLREAIDDHPRDDQHDALGHIRDLLRRSQV